MHVKQLLSPSSMRGQVTLSLGASKDTWISGASHNLNNGGDNEGRVIGSSPTGKSVMFLAFDVSAIPGGTTILQAILRLAFFASTALGDTHWVYKTLYDDWEEMVLTYHIYKAATPWATGGHFGTSDFVTAAPAGASAVIPALIPPSAAVEWDIADIIQDAVTLAINANIVVLGLPPQISTVRYDSREAVASADRPSLTVTF